MTSPATYRLGKKPPRTDPRTLAYASYRTGTATAPPQAHWGHGLSYAMDGNSQYGDCVEAAYAHQVQTWTTRAGSPVVPSGADALAAYTAITGFNPDDPSTDQGTDMLTALGYWRSSGMAGQKITAYAALSPSGREEISEAVAWYGGAYIGVQLPLSAQSQVGTEWTVTTGPDAAAGSWGGHCIPLCGYDQDVLWCVTWGALQAMTWEFLATYCDEAFVMLAAGWIGADGTAPPGLNWAQLTADLAGL